MKVEKLSDGTQLVYYDASSLAQFTNTEGVVPIRAFMFKILKVDIPHSRQTGYVHLRV